MYLKRGRIIDSRWESYEVEAASNQLAQLISMGYPAEIITENNKFIILRGRNGEL